MYKNNDSEYRDTLESNSIHVTVCVFSRLLIAYISCRSLHRNGETVYQTLRLANLCTPSVGSTNDFFRHYHTIIHLQYYFDNPLPTSPAVVSIQIDPFPSLCHFITIEVPILLKTTSILQEQYWTMAGGLYIIRYFTITLLPSPHTARTSEPNKNQHPNATTLEIWRRPETGENPEQAPYEVPPLKQDDSVS